ncbi:FUSC family protein [Desulfoluna spongiiphila]|uniref:FUSC family protein n=1 Tax=Desulfoluna spongiiphila TaxID=419481 RepID=UPI001D032A22|nr:FUSC family protein [Desulfoluna spongiiphila]
MTTILFKRLAGNIVGTLAGLLLVGLLSQTGLVYALACGSLAMFGTYAMLETRHPQFWRWAVVAAGLVTLTRVDTPIIAFYLGMDRVCGVSIGLVAVVISHQAIFPRYAGEDYRDNVIRLIEKLSELSSLRANQAIQDSITPLLQPGDFSGSIALLRDELRHACRDTEAFRKKRMGHERVLSILDDLATHLTLICTEPPSASFDLKSRSLSACYLRTLANRLNTLRTALPHMGEAPCPFHGDNDPGPVPATAFQGPWCELIPLAHECLNRLEYEARQCPFTEVACTQTAPKPRKEDPYGGPFHSALKALLAGAATTLGMILWRCTGWPGGSGIPLLATLQIIFCTAGPALTLPFVVVIQFVAIVLSALLLFFVLPAIHSTEFFFIVIASIFTFWGWVMHAPNPRVRGLGMLVGVLMNSCVYSYSASMASFAVVTSYAWCMIGGTLVSGPLIALFYPSSPKRRFHRYASCCLEQIRLALSTSSSKEALESLDTARQHARLMMAWAGPASRGMCPTKANHAAMAALAADSLSRCLVHGLALGKGDHKRNGIMDGPSNQASTELRRIYRGHADQLAMGRMQP